MKKTYIAPEVEVMNIETVEMIAASLSMFEEGGEDQSLANDRTRRGRWGNLWDSED